LAYAHIPPAWNTVSLVRLVASCSIRSSAIISPVSSSRKSPGVNSIGGRTLKVTNKKNNSLQNINGESQRRRRRKEKPKKTQQNHKQIQVYRIFNEIILGVPQHQSDVNLSLDGADEERWNEGTCFPDAGGYT
jgi:hypothetical protein